MGFWEAAEEEAALGASVFLAASGAGVEAAGLAASAFLGASSFLAPAAAAAGLAAPSGFLPSVSRTKKGFPTLTFSPS